MLGSRLQTMLENPIIIRNSRIVRSKTIRDQPGCGRGRLWGTRLCTLTMTSDVLPFTSVSTSIFTAFARTFPNRPGKLWLEIFYLNYLPYITIVILLFSITFLINPKNKIEYIVLFLSIVNPSTLLLIERMNFDIFIFLISIFIIFNRFYFINWFLIIFFSLTKIYPSILGINIILENKNRKLLTLILIILGISLLSILYVYFNFEKYRIIFESMGGWKAGYHYLFSLKTIPKIMKYLFHWNYIFLVILFLFLLDVYQNSFSCYNFLSLKYGDTNRFLAARLL